MKCIYLINSLLIEFLEVLEGRIKNFNGPMHGLPMPLPAAAGLSEAPSSPGVHVTLKRLLLPRFYEQNCRHFSLIVAQLVSLSVSAAENCLPNHVPPSLSLCLQLLTPGIYYYYVTELAFYWSLMFSQFTDIKRKVRGFSSTLYNYHRTSIPGLN